MLKSGSTLQGRWFRLLALVGVLAAVLVGLAVPQPAYAAGSLSLAITPVDATTGAVITTAGTGQNDNRVAYRVDFSCLVEVCTDTQVTLPATALDPTWNQFRLLGYNTWTPPSTPAGATIDTSGATTTGLVVSLGDLAAGTSSSFTIVYSHVSGGTYTTVIPPAYFPPGFQIEQSATISSDSATGTTEDAAAVTWQIAIPSPAIQKSGPTTAKPDTNVTYKVRMASGCFQYGGSGRIETTGALLCAESYVVTDRLPAQAVYVSSSDGGVYNSVDHTVTWTLSGPNAAGGWGSANTTGWVSRGVYHPRSVTVTYPAANFPEAAGGSDFSVPVTNSVDVSVTYLDDDETTKTASASTTHDVARITPFGRATTGKESTYDAYSGSLRYIDVPPDTTGVLCPSEGVDDWGRSCTPSSPVAVYPDNIKYWYVDTYNRANVPGVAIVTDSALGQPNAPVYQITTNRAASINWTLNTGATGTASGTTYTAPGGTWITAATVTSSTPLSGPNIQPTDNGGTLFRIAYYYRVTTTAPVGEQRTNTVSARMTYPDYPEIDDIVVSAGRTIQFRAEPLVSVTPGISAGFLTPTVAGGGLAVPGSLVTFQMRGATTGIPANVDIEPQYVFIAPEGWVIQPGSASFPSGSVPDGVSFVQRTVTIDGIDRQVVIARWPAGVSFGENVAWPYLSVIASPTYAVAAGTTSQAAFWAGDAAENFDSTEANWSTLVADTPDVDGDGNDTEPFAQATVGVQVSSSPGLSVRKEICLPDGTGDCTWVSNPDIVVGVAPTATDIRYRVTLQNTGNTTLDGIVAYDILPWPDDTGTTTASASADRGSDFAETLSAVGTTSANLTLTFSGETNPCRPEVYPGSPGCVDDWGLTAAGASAIRAEVDAGGLAPGETATFQFDADIVGPVTAGEVACNSVAVDTDTTLPTEPAAVCATTQEADLSIELPDRLPLQAGRPGVVPYVVTNHGGSPAAPATVDIEIPEGVRVTNLSPAGWACTPSTVQPDGSIVGPVTLSCDAVTSTGTLRQLAIDVPDALDIPAVIPDASLIGDETCFPAEVSGLMYDPVDANNTTSACFEVLATAGIEIAKTDGLTSVGVGDEYTYTLTATNGLVGETLSDVTVTDQLPDSVVFVSATGGGVVSDQGTADAFGNTPGGAVTWNFASLGAAGVSGPDGDAGTGGTGSVVTLEVTVRVIPGATGDIVNLVDATAPDPFQSQATLDDSDTDTDGLYLLAIEKTSDAPQSGVRIGSTIGYTVTVRNDGTADFVDATITDDLSGVLDEATFVSGSAMVSIDGGTPEDVATPVGDQLTWIGTISAGSEAVLTYQVLVGDAADGQLMNTAVTSPAPTDCDAATGLDEDGLACAVLNTPFAPIIAKTVESLTQADDGSWTIEYGIDVTNPAPVDTLYDIADDLAFGPGITVTSATVTPPAGVTAETWTGAGDIALDSDLPATTTHHYTITVVANAGTVAGTAAAVCTTGAALGFANTATLTLSDATERDAEACAEPTEPTVTKELDGAPVQGVDGRWTMTYLVTVTNAAEQPTGGLAYHLEDSLDFPAGLTVDEVQVTPPAGVAANADFTGALTEVGGATVTADPELVDGVARIPSAAGGVAAIQVYRVQLIVTAGVGSVDPSLVTCGPTGAGYGNWVSLLVGTTELGRATACADIRLPELQFTKIADHSAGTRPGDRITYTIVATNVGDADFTAGDPAELVDDMSGLLDDARYLGNATADSGTVLSLPPNLTWTGALPAGDTVEITYSALLSDAGSGDGTIVNQVRLASVGVPGGSVSTCADTPAGNAGEPACAVTLQLDTRSLAFTGMAIPLLALLAAAFAAIAVGIALTRRRRLRAG